MAKKPRRMTLYEAVRPSRGGFETPAYKKPDSPDTAKPVETARDQVVGRRRQSSRRIVLVIPYNVAGAIVLALVLALVIAFKTGQISGRKRAFSQVADSSLIDSSSPEQDVGRDSELSRTIDLSTSETDTEQERLMAPAGDHEIVVVQYAKPEDLKPVMEFFAYNGVQTKIEKRKDTYFLVTEDRYQNPDRPGSDGNRAFKRIKQIGLNYKAPQGFETFKPNLFEDAYGAKLK